MGVFGDYALKYLESGYLPLPLDGKACYLPGWTNEDVARDVDKIIDFHFDDNIGILLGPGSGIVAFDFDLYSDGFETLSTTNILALLFEYLPETEVWKKGKKGATLFYRYQNGIENDNLAGVFDFLVTGKQTAVPPSIYIDKEGIHHPEYDYQWGPVSLLDVKPLDLPIITKQHIAKFKEAYRRYEKKTEVGPNGDLKTPGRNNRLYKMCCGAIAKNKPLDIIVQELFRYDRDFHKPSYFANEYRNRKTPLERAENFVNVTLRNLQRRGKETDYGKVIEMIEITDDFLDNVADAQNGMEYIKYPIPPGILGELVEMVDFSAYRSQTNYAIGAVTSFLGVACANKFICNEVFSNIYNLNVGETGSGKERPQKILKQVMLLNKRINWLGENYGSDAAYLEGLAERLERLDIVDECAALLKESSNPSSNSNFKKMATIMLDLYTKPGSVYVMKKTITHGAASPIFSPCVSFWGTTTPNGLADAISIKDFHTGLIPRFNVFFGDTKSSLNIFPEKPKYNQISAILKPLLDVSKQRDGNGYVCNFTEVKFDKEHFISIAQEIESNYQASHGSKAGAIRALLTRQIEKMCKYMICCAALENQKSPFVSEAALNWAYLMTQIHIKEMVNWLDLKDTSLYNLLYREALAEGKSGISKANLTYRFKNFSKKLRDETILELIEDGKLISRSIKNENSKKPCEMFYATRNKNGL